MAGEMAAIQDPVDLERYLRWFTWARANLGRELEATHAAAEAAYAAEAAGSSEEEARTAALKAGAEPDQIDSETIAVAEWAAWAQATYRVKPAPSLLVAKHALGQLDATHDLDRSIRDVSAVLTGQVAQYRKSANNRVWIVVGAILAVVLIAGAAAGLISGSKQTYYGPIPDTTPVANITVTVDPSSGDASLVAWQLPPESNVFVFVGDEWQKTVMTDSKGRLQTTVNVPRGGSPVTVCLDTQHAKCPASTFVTRP
jgi:hypothetical protein